jgi:hypothetical protein
LQGELEKLLQAESKQPACSSKQQPSIMDIMHLALNQQKPAAAVALFDCIWQQRKQLLTKQQQLQQQQNPQQQRRMATRNRARSEQKQVDMAQQVQQLQQRLQDFDQGAQGSGLEHLLATAVARGHVNVIGYLCVLPAALQLPGDAILQLLHRSIVHRSPLNRITSRMLQLAAAVDDAVGAEAAADAAAWDDDDVAGQRCVDQQQQRQPQHKQEQRQLLLSGPAAQQQLLRLLNAAVSRGNAPAAWLLVEQQVLQELDAAACSRLAQTAVEQRDGATLDALLKLPGMQAMPVQDVEQLLSVAAQSRSRYIILQLASLPNATAVSPASVAAMLAGAFTPDGTAVAAALQNLPTAQNISSDDTVALAEAALAAATPPLASLNMQLVCSLPAAAQLPPAVLARLLATAVQIDSQPGAHVTNGSVVQLCALTPAVLGLAASDVTRLLQAAAELGNPAVLSTLCQLPAATQMQADGLYVVLQAAISACKPAINTIVGVLCNKLEGAAQQLQPQQLHSLLVASVHLVNIGVGTGVVSALLRLPAAQQLQPADVSALVALALQTQRSYHLLNVLLALLPAAKHMEAAQLAAHVRTALAMERVSDAAALLGLPPAFALAADDVAALLLTLFGQTLAFGRMQNAAHVFGLMCTLPAAQQLQPHRYVQLLQELLRLLARLQQQPGSGRSSLTWLQKLLALAPAAQVSAAETEQLLRFALQQLHAAVPLLCQLPAAEQLDSAALHRLLSAAVASAPAPTIQRASLDSTSSSSNSSQQVAAVSRLCKLPGVQAMQPEAFASLLRSALHHGRADLLKCLAAAGGPAETVEKGVLLDLLQTAVQRMTGKVGAELVYMLLLAAVTCLHCIRASVVCTTAHVTGVLRLSVA